jgi:lysophospholipase L1-like esterase
MQKKIILIGDSITEAFKTNDLLPNFNIINKGIYGDNTTGVLNRLKKDVIDEKPDSVFLLIGTNDFALERTDEELTGNIKKIINELLTGLPGSKIYLTPILPTNAIENRPNDRIREVNKTLLEFTKEKGIVYFDLYSRLVNIAGELDRKYTVDGLHLSAAAYNVWAEFLESEIRK